MDECVLFKIDAACAFRNLRVDPMDSLKFGIKWNGSYYGLTHGSMVFQIVSDSVAHIVAKARIKLHSCIDDWLQYIPYWRSWSACTAI